MNRNEMKKAEEPRMHEFEELEMDPELKQALGDFKASVHAWSEAEFARPRAAHASAHGLRRWALGWSVAGVLLASGVSGVVMLGHGGHQGPAVATVHPAQPAQRSTEPVQPVATQDAAPTASVTATTPESQDEELMASVDSAVSRTVPSAMDPLVDLGTESGTGK
ncbi:MAG TPA: hypothetical protein VN151_11775 [Terracidiphilus sp.]|nr:hypothetical protein [Terracidiphilus sp.]